MAAVEQREVYLCPPPFGTKEKHPFIVLSTAECNAHERTFLGVMITSSEEFLDYYSFKVSDHMFDHPLRKQGCHVRMHIVTLFLHENIEGNKLNRMKEFYFNELMKSIGELVFNFDFKPL